MNPIQIHAHFNTVPENFDTSKLRLRTTCLVGLAIGAMVQLPGAEIERGALRQFYMDNSKVLRDVAFQINEAVPFSVDRAVDYGYRIFERRWEIANYCNPIDLIAPGGFHQELEESIPELKECALEGNIMRSTMQCLREGVAELTGA